MASEAASDEKAVGADINAVKDVLERDGLSVVGPSADGDLSMRVSANGVEWTMLVIATDDDRLVVYSFLPSQPNRPTADIDAVIGRVNDGMILGNFEYDAAGNAVRFKTSVAVAGVAVCDELIRQLVYANVATVERYLPVFESLSVPGTPIAKVTEMIAALDAPLTG